ncbi:MAG TPA: hypothetical protein VFB62_01165 [Polyangiaceae bacterium]|jgi:hypothetical protein|nr:hypothetical protein [Polyangiaceae bacterium]
MRFLSFIFAAALVMACAEGDRGRDTDDDDTTSTSSVGGGSGGGVPGTCNNGQLDAGEQCDGTEFGGTTCESLGLMGGMIACDATCTIDATGCGGAVCGDGIVGTSEDCDGENLDGQSCASLGFSSGTLSCDSMCKFTGCNDAFTDDFEGGSLGSNWMTTGSAVWAPSNVTPHAGTYCAKSGFITDSQTSSLTTTLTFDAAGTVTFWHRESTESSYDYLQFYIDSALQAEWSGSNAWAMAMYNVTQGTHVLEWRYSKDGSLSDYEDSVYIDDIAVTNGFAP